MAVGKLSGWLRPMGHELAHVQQFSQGMTLRSYLWASRRGYWRNPFEVEARAIGARIRAEMCGEAKQLAQRNTVLGVIRPSSSPATASATSIPSTPADMMPPA